VALGALKKAGLSPASSAEQRKSALDDLLARQPLEKLAAELGCGVPTLGDIFEQLVRPGRDPREEAPLPLLRSM